jgi:hypothetical protein
MNLTGQASSRHARLPKTHVLIRGMGARFSLKSRPRTLLERFRPPLALLPLFSRNFMLLTLLMLASFEPVATLYSDRLRAVFERKPNEP